MKITTNFEQLPMYNAGGKKIIKISV